MLISIIGSHGTGKTTLINHLRRHHRTDWPVFTDYYRSTAKSLGYARPRDILLEDAPNKDSTITAMTSAALGAAQQWLDNNPTHTGFIDMGPPSMLAYQRYWMAVCKKTVSPYLLHLCRRVSDQNRWLRVSALQSFPNRERPYALGRSDFSAGCGSVGKTVHTGVGNS